MMNKKCIKETIFDLVNQWCLEDYKADLPWIRGQISFAFIIGAITLSEKNELIQRLYEVKEGEHGE